MKMPSRLTGRSPKTSIHTAELPSKSYVVPADETSQIILLVKDSVGNSKGPKALIRRS